MSNQVFQLESHPEIDWSDVEPLRQYEGKMPILDIKYQAKYEKMMDIFRRIIHTSEISERSYHLAGEVVRKMCGSYSAWFVRKSCLEKLNLSYEAELEFTNQTFVGNEKNYQIWEHRRFLISHINSPKNEIEFLNSILQKDNKNIHAWGYRKWLVEKFNLIEEEKKNILEFFEEDVRNNSAWNFRYFLQKSSISKENLSEELKFVFEKIKEVYDNEASWNYLNGWFSSYNFQCFGQAKDFSPPHLKKFSYLDYPEVESFAREVLKDDPNCRFASITLVNILVWKQTKEAFKEMIQIIEELETQTDKVRINYWQWYKTNLEKDFAELAQ